MPQVKRTCIVDDDPIFVFTTKKLMGLNDFSEEIIVYENGQEAIDALSEMAQEVELFPDVLLVDLNMPLMDGWEFLKSLMNLKIEKIVLIYIVTSSIDPEDVRKAKEFSKVKNYLVKPITSKTINNMLAEFKEDLDAVKNKKAD